MSCSSASLPPHETAKAHMIRIALIASLAAALAAVEPRILPDPIPELPGRQQWTWAGNSFPCLTWKQNRAGRWVQSSVTKLRVSPEGTVIVGTVPDEGGRCLALYGDGDVNDAMLGQNDQHDFAGHSCWGYGTANHASAVDGATLLLVNVVGELVRFAWKPGDIQSARFVDTRPLGKASGLDARNGTLAVLLDSGELQLRRIDDLAMVASVPGVVSAIDRDKYDLGVVRDVVFESDRSLLVLADQRITRWSTDGNRTVLALPGLGLPLSIAIDRRNGRLLVGDGGPRQQVLIYELGAAPKLVATLGAEGGLRSGTPGEITPGKLFGPRGVGVDAQGNIAVAMMLGPDPNLGMMLRSYAPDGSMRWQVSSHHFNECGDLASDGDIYGMTAILGFDPARPEGKQWWPKAFTLDPLAVDDDRSGKRLRASGAFLRELAGRRVMFTTSGMGLGGFDAYTWKAGSYIAQRMGTYGVPAGEAREVWARDVDATGAIWAGDTPQGIQCWSFTGFAADGTLGYEAAPRTWPMPAPFTEISRVLYDAAADALYVSGSTTTVPKVEWGLVGGVLARYDGWKAGRCSLTWMSLMPRDDGGLYPKSLALAGDHLFATVCKTRNHLRGEVFVFAKSDGRLQGLLSPPRQAGLNMGWCDIPYGLRAVAKPDGSYVVITEENWHNKQSVYLWQPRTN